MTNWQGKIWVEIVAISVVGIFVFSNVYAQDITPYKQDQEQRLPVYKEPWKTPKETSADSELHLQEAGIMEGEYQPIPLTQRPEESPKQQTQPASGFLPGEVSGPFGNGRGLPIPEDSDIVIGSEDNPDLEVTDEQLRKLIYYFEKLVREGRYAETVGKFQQLIDRDPALAIAVLNNMNPITSAYIINECEGNELINAAWILSYVDPEVVAQILIAAERQSLMERFPYPTTGEFLPVPATTIISFGKAAQILGMMDIWAAGQVLILINEWNPDKCVSIINNMSNVTAATILLWLHPKEAALILANLDEQKIAGILTAEPRWVIPAGPLFSPEYAALILNLLGSLWGDTSRVSNIIFCMHPVHSAPIIKAMLNTEGAEKVASILQPLSLKAVAGILAYDKEIDYRSDGLTVDECVQILQAIDDEKLVESILEILDSANPEKAKQIRESLYPTSANPLN